MTRSPVIDAREALLNLQQAGVCDQAVHFLDSSWHLPTSTRNARQEYEDCHIEGAQFFDIDRMSDPHNPIPHSVPDPAFFASELQKLGLNQDDLVICYEQGPLAMAARAWFLLRLFGHEQVVVLNGGIKAWQEAGGPFSSGRPPAVPKGNFTAQTPSSSRLCSM
ncbi:MAG: rhodanese-like domain-containing protein, partial [Pseudomonadota bacterium]